VGVSPRPGFTTSLQEVVLDKNIRLIDSPGVVFDDDDSKAGAGAVLRNGIDPDSIDDPIPAIQELIGRCSMESLMMTYNVPAFPTGPEGCLTFLAMIARSKGRVLKGGIPDKVMAGRLVIKDWNKGKIPYYSVPPTDKVDATSVGGAKILNQFSEKFDINKILEDHDNELMQELDDVDEMDFVQMNSVPRNAVDAEKVLNYLKGNNDEDSDDSMEEEEEDGAHINAQMQDAEDFDFDS
jgi:nuclear GTP-binding protein